MGLPEMLVLTLIAVVCAFPYWRIAKKMGYPGAVGILACLPIINIIVAYALAFTDWPTLQESRISVKPQRDD